MYSVADWCRKVAVILILQKYESTHAKPRTKSHFATWQLKLSCEATLKTQAEEHSRQKRHVSMKTRQQLDAGDIASKVTQQQHHKKRNRSRNSSGSLLSGLSSLLYNNLAHVPDTLTLVWLRWPLTADVSTEVS